MSKVTGIGGVFFKCKDPDKVKDWYKEQLGMNTDEYGCSFKFKKLEDPEKNGYLQWSPFKQDTEYFQPSEKEFMINYRVDNLAVLLENLRKNGVEVVGEIQEFDYGKFAHVLDPEGNKLELWEPVDEVFDAI